MMEEHNVVSVSGGKDSTALLLLALERGAENMQAVFADTGNEHPTTYQYLEYLDREVFPIRVVKADYTDHLRKRREMMERVIAGEHKERAGSKYVWTPEVARQALEILHPTGNPFLDMCLVHGRFPSTRVRFCSKELKRDVIIGQVQMPIMRAGHDLVSWQGVRADESPSRALLPESECKQILENGAELWNFRPILKWTVEEVFAMHRKYGVEPNPLYKAGMSRVGCMPCIHANKNEVLEISRRFPEEFRRIERWEALVQKASKTGKATFFSADGVPMADIDTKTHGIWGVVEWSKTSRGGKQFDMLRAQDGPLCSSIYGLCE